MKRIILILGLVVSDAFAACPRPGVPWYDTAGHVINAHGGGVIFHEGAYWWYGEHKVYGEAGNRAHVGVHVYSSTNLVDWADRGVALAVSNDAQSDIADGCILERPKVLRSRKTGKFVMYFHLELKGQGYRAARTGIAVADRPEGPFVFVRSLRPTPGSWPADARAEERTPEAMKASLELGNDEAGDLSERVKSRVPYLGHIKGGQMSRDMTLFEDDDGRCYHIFASEYNSTLHIAELTDDLLDYTGRWFRLAEKEWTEAPAICKHGGWYFLIGSGCTGWKPNQARLYRARKLEGPWERIGNPCRGVSDVTGLGPELTWGGQSTFFLPVAGSPDRVLAMFDVWHPENHEESRYVWLPVTFEKDRLWIDWQSAGQGLVQDGFFVGCNYWASHAGVYMWRDWRPDQVEKDLDRLASCGMTVLRVFPLWPDFQPLTADFGGGQSFRGYSQAGGPLKNYAAVDDEMIGRFRFFCDAAEKRGIRLVVGLVTGWMSGRSFVPSALERMKVLSDPEAIVWEVRFVRYFVNALKDHRAIAAWDLGNECNCLSGNGESSLWTWMHQIASEIRICDPSRSVVSGMHSCTTKADGYTNLRHQGELVDILTTHPYPLWTPNCNTEPFDSIRNGCHAACETALYSDLSGKTAFAEEAGSMGPQIVSEERAAATMRMQLFSAWACGQPGYLWWCGFDQNRLEHAPYDWTAIERELGLFKSDGTPKPTALTLRDFKSFLSSLPFGKLPPRRIDAVVVASESADCWKQMQGAWLLSRMAGFDIRYAFAEGDLPESGFYVLPSTGDKYNAYSRRAFWRVMERAKAGATVLVTLGNGAILSDMEEVAGIRTEAHYEKGHSFRVKCPAGEFDIAETHVRDVTPVGCEVLARDAEDRPVMTAHAYGKGKVLFFNGALETNAQLAGWPAYRLAAEQAGVTRCVTAANPMVGVTEHPAADGRIIAVVVNYSSSPQDCEFGLKGRVGAVWRGRMESGKMRIPANDAAVFEVLGK